MRTVIDILPRHPSRLRLLITGTINRLDIVKMFGALAGEAELWFLEYDRNYDTVVDRGNYAGFGNLITWESFASTDELLDEIDPDCLVFLFITALNQVALRQAASRRGIRTIHLEHGYRLPFDDPGVQQLERGRRIWRERFKTVGHSTRTHRFFVRSLVAGSSAPVRGDLLRYAARIGLRGRSLDTQRAMAHLRRPDHYISYSPECFQFHRDLDRLSEVRGPKVTFVGVPQFDEFRDDPSAEVDDAAILLIDHALHNTGVYGWSSRARHEWVDQIRRVVRDRGFRLYVKTHPYDHSHAWVRYADDPGVRLISSSELVEVSRSARAVLGIFSTLQLPLTGLSHTASVTLEIHPKPGWYPSQRLVESGAAVAARSFSDLRDLLRDPASLAARQRRFKSDFIERFLYRLDGRSGDRLRDALLAVARGDAAPMQ